MASLLDFDSDDEEQVTPQQAVLPEAKVHAEVLPLTAAGPPLEGATSAPEGEPLHEAPRDDVATIPVGEDAKDDDLGRFGELGGVFLPRPLNFQGPDIDHYLRLVFEVDIATMMAMLIKEIGLDAVRMDLPAGAGSSSSAETTQLEVENFDIEGEFF